MHGVLRPKKGGFPWPLALGAGGAAHAVSPVRKLVRFFRVLRFRWRGGCLQCVRLGTMVESEGRRKPEARTAVDVRLKA